MPVEKQILEELKMIRSEIGEHRTETRKNFRAMRSQLKVLEFGILTIAQKLLAESEVEELEQHMAATG